MSITTAGDLINYCFRVSGVAGVGQSVSADDANDALETLNEMLAQWQQKRWLTYGLFDNVLASTGATTYSFGFADRIESAFARLLGNTGGQQIDYPLQIVHSAEDWNRIALKTFTGGWPQLVYYETAYPFGDLHFWPVPQAGQFELHVFTKIQFSETSPSAVLPALTSLLAFPPEYREALKYGLVVRITMDYGLDPKPAHVAAYRGALNTIRQSNTQIPTARMPPGLPGMRRGGGIGNDMVGQGFGRAFILDGGAVI